MLKLLIIDDIVPRSSIGYGYPRALTLYNSLSALGFALTFIPLESVTPVENNQKKEINNNIKIVNFKSKNEVFGYIKKNLQKFNAVFISRPKNFRFLIDYLLTFPNRPTIIYDAEALSSLRQITRLKLTNHHNNAAYQEMIDEELNLIAKADFVSCVSHYEMELLKGRLSKNYFFFSHYHDAIITTKPFKERKNLLFVGGFYAFPCPNLDALRFFIDEIFPKINASLDVKLIIVGYNAEQLHHHIPGIISPNIIIINDAVSLFEYYNDARVTVIPTRIGAGISYKFTETLSYGTPSVTTGLIAKQVVSKNKYIGYDDPDQFADRVIALYNNEEIWQESRELSMEIIRTNYTKQNLENEIMRLNNLLTLK